MGAASYEPAGTSESNWMMPGSKGLLFIPPSRRSESGLALGPGATVPTILKYSKFTKKNRLAGRTLVNLRMRKFEENERVEACHASSGSEITAL